MRFTIERIRTLVLVAAVLLLGALGVFLARAKWKNLLSGHDMPQRLAKNIVQESNDFNYSHNLGAHSKFKIHASRAIQLRNDHIELHDVQIELYAEDGTRIDRIAGDTFEYDQKAGVATAQGPVEMLLTRPAATAAEVGQKTGRAISQVAAVAGSKEQIDVKTSGVAFDRNNGIVTTSKQLNFSMTQGNGSAVGARYDSQSGHLTLERAVELTTHRGSDRVAIHAQHAEFDRGAQNCELRGTTAEFRSAKANAAQATILFRADGSAQTLDALGGFTVETPKGGHLAAPTGHMEFNEHNQPRHGHLEGGVTMDSINEGRKVRGSAPSAELEFTALGMLKSAHLERGVAMESDETISEENRQTALHVRRTWHSPVVDLVFRQQKQAGKGVIDPETLRGTGGVVVTSESRLGNGPAMPSRMTADTVTGAFALGGAMRSITGSGHATMEQTTATGARQTASSDRLQVQFAQSREQGNKGAREQGSRSGNTASGGAAGIQSAELDGHVVLIQQPAPKPGAPPQPPIRATAGKAECEDTGQWLHLTINPRIVNGGLELTAVRVDVSRQSGDAFAHGNVKGTWAGGSDQASAATNTAGQGGLTLGGKGPAHVIAADAQLDESTGEATFRGHARLWQQANSVSGPLIVLNQHLQTLTAHSSDGLEPVRAVMLSANAAGNTTGLSANPRAQGRAAANGTAPSVIRVSGADLWYSDAEHRAVMRGGALGSVVAETGTASSTSDSVELRLMPANLVGSGSAGQAQVDRMTATGHVVLTSQGRRGTGERLEYSSVTGEYVLTGTTTAPPRMTDPERGSVTGEALIFHSRDDSVSIEGGGRETRTETTAPEVHGKQRRN